MTVRNVSVREANWLVLGFSPDWVANNARLCGGVKFKTLAEKLEGLASLGFPDPVKLIEKYTWAATLTPEAARVRLERLQKIGFINPIDLVTRIPPYLGVSSEYVENKVNLLSRHFPRDVAIKVMSGSAKLLSAKDEKLEILLILLRNKATVNNACFLPLDKLIAAMLLWPDIVPSAEMSYSQMLGFTKMVEPSQGYLREYIKNNLGRLSKNIAELYAKGYLTAT